MSEENEYYLTMYGMLLKKAANGKMYVLDRENIEFVSYELSPLGRGKVDLLTCDRLTKKAVQREIEACLEKTKQRVEELIRSL